MNRTVTLAVVTLVSALATPVVVNATAPNAAPVAAPVATATAAAAKPEELTCDRRVRVVYAGYGEGQSACAAPVR